jgi:hypothetical protein
VANRLALFDEATPDDKHILVHIEYPIGEHGRGSLASHASNRLRDRSVAGKRSIPYRISAIVTLLRNRLDGS